MQFSEILKQLKVKKFLKKKFEKNKVWSTEIHVNIIQQILVSFS